MSRERPRSGDGEPTPSEPTHLLSRRRFLYGGFAAAVLVACGPRSTTTDPETSEGGTADPSGEPDSSQEATQRLAAEPGSPAVAGQKVVLTSASGAFGPPTQPPGKVLFHPSDSAPDETQHELEMAEDAWSPNELVVTIPVSPPAAGTSTTAAGPRYAPYRLTVQPEGGSAVHVDVFVWNAPDTQGYEDPPKE